MISDNKEIVFASIRPMIASRTIAEYSRAKALSSTTSIGGNVAEPIQIPNRTTSTAGTNVTSAVQMFSKSKLNVPIRSDAKRVSTPEMALKRQNSENVPSTIQAKVRKVTTTFSNWPEVSITCTDEIGGVERRTQLTEINPTSTSANQSKNRSVSECLQLLRRNGVTVFLVSPKKRFDE